MAKYALLNCWTDRNKGDLGIMIATIEEIRKVDIDARIIGISCFSDYDEMFHKRHIILKDYVDELYPALYGNLIFCIGQREYKNTVCKILLRLFELIRMAFVFVLPNKCARLFLTQQEISTLTAIMSCDISIAKGGSVFVEYANTLRARMALTRICNMYDLLHKFHCPYYILGQSFGPVRSKRGIRDVNRVIHNAEKVFLREFACVKEYPELALQGDNILFSNDAGFLLPSIKPSGDTGIVEGHFNVGMTLRPAGEDMMAYECEMAKVIQQLCNIYGADVHIFPQVSEDSEPDNTTALRIIKKIEKPYQSQVYHHTENLRPQEMKYQYGQMRIFIGTRLHSTIFALSAGTPAIVLVYHGTKAQGIFDAIGIPEMVVLAPITSEKVMEQVSYAVNNRDRIKNTIAEGVMKAQKDMTNAIRIIINDASKRK